MFLTIDDPISTYKTPGGDALPKYEATMVLSDQKNELERAAYTLFIFIGDMGGFWGAIVGLVNSVMSWYSARMYQSSVFAEVSVKKRNKKTKNKSAL